MNDQEKHTSFLTIPNLPNRKAFRLYLLILLISTTGTLFIPFSLALSFTGILASDGPTKEIKAPTDSSITEIATENKLLQTGEMLFRFNQQKVKAEISVIHEQLKSIEDRIKISVKECQSVRNVLDESLEHASQTFALKKYAFQLEAISQLNFLSARREINVLKREIARHEQECTSEERKLVGERNILLKELEKQNTINSTTEIVVAPTNGYLHRVNVKEGQYVTEGEILASYTSQGTAGATLLIPLIDRPFVRVNDTFLITSDAYQLLRKPPIRQCTITSISPDSFMSREKDEFGKESLTFQAQCEFEESPMTGDYPFLVGMSLNGSATSVKASLIQILLDGYRRLLTTRQLTNRTQ